MPGGKNSKHSEETKTKLSIIAKERGYLVGNLYSLGVSRPASDYSKQRASEVHKGRIHSPEHNEKVSLALKGRSLSDDQKANISKSQLGKSHSAERNKKQSEACLRGINRPPNHKGRSWRLVDGKRQWFDKN